MLTYFHQLWRGRKGLTRAIVAFIFIARHEIRIGSYARTKNNGGEGGRGVSFYTQEIRIFYLYKNVKNVHGTWLSVVFQRAKCILNVYCAVHVWDSLWGTGISHGVSREKF